MDSQRALPMERPAIPSGGEEDLISGLPDEILHIILVRLPSAAAAARTSVFSCRWRGVWAHMPELVLGGSPASATTPSALLDSIDAALNSSAAPTLRSLNIDVTGVGRCDVPAHRISPWLRFASQRIAGKLRLQLYLMNYAYGDIKEELALPICERATEIDLYIATCNVFLRLPPTGSFSLLTDLKISCAEMDGGELGRVVSSLQCPRLRELHLFVLNLKPVRDISISSESLQCLHLSSCNGKLEVTAPMLQEIIVSSAVEACIVASPKLEKVAWLNTYDPGRHQFLVAGRHLRSLSIMHSSISSTRLMERFDTASELTVYLALQKWQGIAGYTTFLKEMEKLPICETLVVNLMTNHHVFAPMALHLLGGCSCVRKFKLIFYRYAPSEGIAGYTTFLKEMEKLPICETLVVHLILNDYAHALAPMMLHLLRRCICIQKFKLILNECTPSEMPSCTMSNCPCLLPENYRLDDITFDSLEEIGISFFTGSAEQEEFVELLLSRCNRMTLKRVDFTVSSGPVSLEIMEVVQRICSMCHPNSKLQFNVNCRKVPKP